MSLGKKVNKARVELKLAVEVDFSFIAKSSAQEYLGF